MIYEYLCDRCDRHWDRVCSLAAYESNPDAFCPYCDGVGRQVLSAPSLITGAKAFESFVSPVDGSLITNKRGLREHNKRNGVVNLHDGYDEKGVRRMTERNYQAELDKDNAADLKKDAEKSIEKLNNGYQPHVEKEVIPS
jgi:hypothetical protein